MKLKQFSTYFMILALILINSFTTFGQNPQDEKLQTNNRLRNRRAFEVTITNLTPASANMMSGQQFSPTTLVTHNANAPKLFEVGFPASFGLQRIAEEGNEGPLSTAVVVPNQGILFGEEKILPSILPGQTRSTVIYAERRFPLLSMVWMLVRTNDGFSGLDSIDLYSFRNREIRTYDLVSYDAGTEVNNELNLFLIAREGTERQPENSVVTSPHPGIHGGGDAPGTWGFDPQLVARVQIKALPLSYNIIY